MTRKIVQGVTSSLSVLFLRDQVKYLEQNGYEVKIVCNNDFDKTYKDIELDHIPFEREINITKDISALYKLFLYLRGESPDIINFSTAKAGLLGMIAGFLNGTGTRIYIIRGLRLETVKGAKSKVLHLTERIACLLSTHVIVISESLEQEVVKRGLVKPDKVMRIGTGSSNGIDLEKFDPEKIPMEQVKALKEELGIGPDDFVMGYIGRITRDKGCNELVEAFEALSEDRPDVKLLLVGDFEDSDAIEQENIDKIHENENIILCGYTLDIQKYYLLMDLFVFPTYREGFGNVSIEAQAMGVPVVTFNVTGARDTLLDGQTGMITKSKDAEGLTQAISHLMESPEVLDNMAGDSRKFVADHFDRRFMQEELLKFYDSLDVSQVPAEEAEHL
ncbi:glycosyltransferase family 4 protein [Salinicoccus kekensis]|uniref:Glycosyltransferase involved in cell wall bisynthesis n=1 Tax=Salinicoccus kekensis TaxID=714307 RepID=A0A285U6X2_9STAP|nr:glycosyltransferase family 4 protein [Salinicoccus kekensis]SOC37690.1 glycosyltransferase involved in cell wall bisynthesis [Salinicoccus kekensis]